MKTVAKIIELLGGLEALRRSPIRGHVGRDAPRGDMLKASELPNLFFFHASTISDVINARRRLDLFRIQYCLGLSKASNAFPWCYCDVCHAPPTDHLWSGAPLHPRRRFHLKPLLNRAA